MASIRWEPNSAVDYATYTLVGDALTTAMSISNDQSTELDLLADFELQISQSAAIAAGDALAELYIIRSIDGANYEDVATGATATVAPGAFAGTFIAGAAKTAGNTARNVVRGVVLPPEDFQVHIKDLTGTPHSFATLAILRYHYQSA